MVGVAVNVQPEDAQPGLLPEVSAILTEGVTEVVTLIVILFEVAVVVEAHEALDVITQLTTSLLDRKSTRLNSSHSL